MNLLQKDFASRLHRLLTPLRWSWCNNQGAIVIRVGAPDRP